MGGGDGLRIQGGRWKGRKLRAPKGMETRPALAMHRAAALNMIHPRLQQAVVLDAFAGSGAFGLEALSRGARRAVLADVSRRALEVIRWNCEYLGVGDDAVEVVRRDAYAGPARGGPFDVVVWAPPYPHFTERGPRMRRRLVELAAGPEPALAPGGVIVVQSETGHFTGQALPGLVPTRERGFGRTTFTLLMRPQDVASESD